MKEIRWKYRFENFSKSFKVLERSLEIESPSEVERGGVIQFYEMSFELAWKMIKDYLQEEGFEVKSPRTAIKQGIQMELLGNPHKWMDALEDRNLTAHTYDEETAKRVYASIKNNYYPILRQLYDQLEAQL
ncbi:MAG: nucleotidyltransferase substrate binding protein [Flavobacteriaceae bacterium]|nr:nucleotidyltransferase substrate binding protein [Flavobacteriaceae bacterium]